MDLAVDEVRSFGFWDENGKKKSGSSMHYNVMFNNTIEGHNHDVF